jgi:transcription antitermination factor NusG
VTVVRRECQFTGTTEEMDIPLSQEELDAGLARSWSWSRQFGGNGEEHMQDIFPTLTPDEREFLQTGTTPAIWNDMFPPEPEFKVGDKVRVKGWNVIGTITEINPNESEFPFEVEFVGKDHNITEIFAEINLEKANG